MYVYAHTRVAYLSEVTLQYLNTFFHGLTALVGVDFIEVSRSHSDTLHSVGLLWMSDRPFAETSTWQQTIFTKDRNPSTLSMTPLDEWSALRRDLYLTKNNIHKRQKSIHTQYDSSGWVIGPSQRPLPVNKQYSQKTEIHPHSVWLLWMSDRPFAETSTWQQTIFTKDGNPCPGGIWTHNRSKRAAADPTLKIRGRRGIYFCG